ncbi:hypothetical protein D3C72_1751900 [compost metagenome]
MAVAVISEVVTMTGDAALGRICVKMIRAGDWPMTTAACTNSRSLRVMNSERTNLATGGQDTIAMAPTIEYSDGLKIATSTSAIASCGMVWKNSVPRIRQSSMRPP